MKRAKLEKRFGRLKNWKKPTSQIMKEIDEGWKIDGFGICKGAKPFEEEKDEKNKYKFRCSFCKREIKGETFGGSIGKMDLCNDCSVELADTVYHAFDKKFGKHICDKLNKIYLKEAKKMKPKYNLTPKQIRAMKEKMFGGRR